MSIDKELLWRAYPDGYLAMRGVSSVEGWLCSGSNEKASHWLNKVYTHETILHEGGPYHQSRDQGDLLPNVDPADAATWACLLQDLSSAVTWAGKPWGAASPTKNTPPPADAPERYSLRWQQSSRGVEAGITFSLQAEAHRITSHREEDVGSARWYATGFPKLRTTDPARALVLARIYLREKEQ